MALAKHAEEEFRKSFKLVRPSVNPERYLAALTPRQREIALLVGSGYRNKEIANRLNITERTVKAHLSMVYLKLKLSRRVRLVHLIAQ